MPIDLARAVTQGSGTLIGQQVWFPEAGSRGVPLIEKDNQTFLRSGHMLADAEAQYPDAYEQFGHELASGEVWTLLAGQAVNITRFVVAGTRLVAFRANGSLLYSDDGAKWHLGAGPGFVVNAAVYAEGRLVVVGANAKVASTSDIINWTERTVSGVSTTTFSSVAFGAGVFVAAGSSGYAAYSSDGGLTWVGSRPFGTGNGSKVLFDGQAFLVGGGTSILRSVTGMDGWTAVATGLTQQVTDIAALGSQRVAVLGTSIARSSDDGLTWTVVSLGIFGAMQVAVNPATGVFMLSSSSETGVVQTSSDGGLTWAARAAAGAAKIQRLLCHEGRFIAVSSAGLFVTVNDGVSWGARTTPFGPGQTINDVVQFGGGFFAGGARGSIVREQPAGAWALACGMPPNLITTQSLTYGNGVYVAVFSGNWLAYWSDDLLHWNLCSGALPALYSNRMIFANGKFIGYAGSSTRVSADGKTWTQRGDIGFTPTAIAYGDGRIVALGSSGQNAYSTDMGVTWTAGAALPNSYAYQSIAFGDGVFFTTARTTGDSYILYTSTDGASWADRTLGAGIPALEVAYFPGAYIAGVGSRGYYSSDLNNWVGRNPNGYSVNSCRPDYRDGRMVASAGSSIVLTEDGINWAVYAGPGTNIAAVAAAPHGVVAGDTAGVLAVSPATRVIGSTREWVERGFAAYMRIK